MRRLLMPAGMNEVDEHVSPDGLDGRRRRPQPSALKANFARPLGVGFTSIRKTLKSDEPD